MTPTFTPYEAHLIGAAYHLAADVHKDQVDKNGVPYFQHVYAVAEIAAKEYSRLSFANDRGLVLVIITAVLHDVLEDFEGSPGEYAVLVEHIKHLFGRDVFEALRYLKHERGVPYEEYVENIATGNAMARVVKIADLTHNLDPKRVPSPANFSRQKYLASRAKYNAALIRLLREV